ncbi:MAG: hypothetical protein WCJ05_02825 [bacterium]
MKHESSRKIKSVGLGLSLAFGSMALSACSNNSAQSNTLRADKYVPEKCVKIFPNNLSFSKDIYQDEYDQIATIDKQISQSVCNVANVISKDTYRLINHHGKHIKFDVVNDGSTIDIMMTDSKTGTYTDTEYWVTKNGQPKFNHIQGLMVGASKKGHEGAINIDLIPNTKGTDWVIGSIGDYPDAKLPKFDSSGIIENPTVDQMKLNQLAAYVLSVEMISHNQ